MNFNPTGSFKSRSEMSDIAYYILRPEGDLRAVLQISHGMCEYFMRYSDFARFLNANGIAVVGNDHLGHGASAADSEHLGFMAENDGWKCMIDDLHTLTGIAKAEFPSVPYILFGHSMGSFIARGYLTKYGDELDGAIICGTGWKNPGTKLGIDVARLEKRIFPPHHRSGFINALAFGAYCKRYENPRTAFDWLSRDERVVDKFMSDPYCNFVFTSSAFLDLLSVNAFVNNDEWAGKVKGDYPILVTAGDMDPVGDYGEGVREVYNQLLAAGKKAELKLYSGARHEILNEINKDEVYRDILSWIESAVIRSPD